MFLTCYYYVRRRDGAQAGGKRALDAGRPGYGDGCGHAAVLDPGAAARGDAGPRRRSRARPAAGRGPRGLPRQHGGGRPAGRLVPAPGRPAVLRPQRAVRAAVHVPRLEVHRGRALHGHAERPAGQRLQGPDPAHELPVRGAPWHGLGLPGTRTARPAVPGHGLDRSPAGPPGGVEAAAVVQLRPGHGGRLRPVPHLVPAQLAGRVPPVRGAGGRRRAGSRRPARTPTGS